jgi:hypothetical protein
MESGSVGSQDKGGSKRLFEDDYTLPNNFEGDKLIDVSSAESKTGYSHPLVQYPKKKPNHLADLRTSRKFRTVSHSGNSIPKNATFPTHVISAQDLRDPTWAERGRKLDIVAGEEDIVTENRNLPFESSQVSNNTNKKHKVNWLALDARRNDADLLEKAASGKLKQRSTALKYGW